MLHVSQLDAFRDDPVKYEAMKKILEAVNKIGQQAGVDPSGNFAQPADVDGLIVAAADGIFDVVINDRSNKNPRGLSYFLEASPNIGFVAPYKWELGATKTMRVHLGNLSLYWRCYSQYVGSAPSSYIYFGNPPAAVVGGGANGPAAPQRPDDPPGYGTPIDNPVPLPNTGRGIP